MAAIPPSRTSNARREILQRNSLAHCAQLVKALSRLDVPVARRTREDVDPSELVLDVPRT